MNSFEILLNDDMSVDGEFFSTREAQCKQIYRDLDVVGWYTTGGVITEQDELFNCQVIYQGVFELFCLDARYHRISSHHEIEPHRKVW